MKALSRCSVAPAKVQLPFCSCRPDSDVSDREDEMLGAFPPHLRLPGEILLTCCCPRKEEWERRKRYFIHRNDGTRSWFLAGVTAAIQRAGAVYKSVCVVMEPHSSRWAVNEDSEKRELLVLYHFHAAVSLRTSQGRRIRAPLLQTILFEEVGFRCCISGGAQPGVYETYLREASFRKSERMVDPHPMMIGDQGEGAKRKRMGFEEGLAKRKKVITPEQALQYLISMPAIETVSPEVCIQAAAARLSKEQEPGMLTFLVNNERRLKTLLIASGRMQQENSTIVPKWPLPDFRVPPELRFVHNREARSIFFAGEFGRSLWVHADTDIGKTQFGKALVAALASDRGGHGALVTCLEDFKKPDVMSARAILVDEAEKMLKRGAEEQNEGSDPSYDYVKDIFDTRLDKKSLKLRYQDAILQDNTPKVFIANYALEHFLADVPQRARGPILHRVYTAARLAEKVYVLRLTQHAKGRVAQFFLLSFDVCYFVCIGLLSLFKNRCGTRTSFWRCSRRMRRQALCRKTRTH